MTRDEAKQVLAAVRMVWPHSTIVPAGVDPAGVVDLWASMLADFTGVEVVAAVKALAHGREHAPPVGVVLACCAERAAGVPAWDVAWPELERKARECVTPRGYRIPRAGEFSHPYVGEFARRWWRDVCPLPDERAMETLRAQLRDAYRSGAARVERERTALSADGPRRLDPGVLLSPGGVE